MDAHSIYRDRTQEFFILRDAAKRQLQWLGSGSAVALTHSESVARSEPPPSWVRSLESFTELERTINAKMELLVAAQRDVFQPRFSASSAGEELESQVVHYNEEIQRLLREVDRITQNVSQLRDSATAAEQHAAGNVRKHLSTRLANLLTSFRKAQSGYTNQMKQREDKKQRFKRVVTTDAQTYERLEREEKVTGFLAMGYSEAEVSELLFLESQKREQNEAISKILESVKEVHDMFADLRDMVIEQGTMLDRIDFNLEKSATSLNKGNEQLKEAREQQKKCAVC